MYVGNSLYCLQQFFGGGVNVKYTDVIEGLTHKETAQDPREVAERVIKNAGLKVGEKQ